MQKKNMRWVYSTIYANIAQGLLSTLVVLYILENGGTVIEAFLAITSGTLISIPASYIWGKFSDMFPEEKISDTHIIYRIICINDPFVFCKKFS